MPTHIFVDNSNIIGGARRVAKKKEPKAPWFTIRVYYKNFFALIENDQSDISTRVMAGSVPPGNDALWDYSRAAGYNVDLLRKVENDQGRSSEQGVDEMLHLKMANCLLDYEGSDEVLVLVTGDGGDSDFGTKFPDYVQRALKRGWKVIVWSWQEQLSKVYERMVRGGAQNLRVKVLDGWYEELTFVQGGTYDEGGAEVTVANRVVASLSV